MGYGPNPADSREYLYSGTKLIRLSSVSERISILTNNKFSNNKRRDDRVKAVLPIRVSGNDASGNSYSDLVHTLDITPTGARLGSVHRLLEIGSLLSVQYRQHKAEFRVIWRKLLANRGEHQVGLEALAQKDVWGLGSSPKAESQSKADAISHDRATVSA